MSTTNRARDRDEVGRLKRNFRGPNATQTTPGSWVRQHMNRPRRLENRRLCRLVVAGGSPDVMVWPLGSRKPHIYRW